MIESFIDEYSFLSNFYFSPIFLNNNLYATVEHYYQAMKTEDFSEHEKIRTSTEARDAKRLGRAANLRSDWESIKNSVMLKGLTAKFRQNEVLAKQLLDTDDEELQEGNNWNDTYWGVSLKSGKGENMLGKLLTQIREELK